MKINCHSNQKGFTLIETVLSVAIFAMISMALFNIFDSILKSVRNNKAILTANSIVLEQMEIVRGMDFNNVRTDTGWVPAGPLPSEKTISREGIIFFIQTDVSWFDDPYDGLESDVVDTDTFPFDYKKVRMRISWTNPIGGGNNEISMSTNVVPVGLEGLADNKGGLYLSVFDSVGIPISSADIEIDNDTIGYNLVGVKTDVNGNIWIPDLEPSDSYHISVTKAGYSTAETYAINNDSTSPDYNPVPSKANASVIAARVSKLGFSIDFLGSMHIKTVHFNNPGNFQINNNSSGEQTAPTMAISPSGQLFVAWSDDRDGEGTSHIYMQKFVYNTGVYSRSWASDVKVVDQPMAVSPKLETLSDGSPVLVWSDKRNGESDIYFQKLSATDGSAIGSEYRINQDTAGFSQANPDLVLDQDGNIFFVWEDNRDGTWDIYSQKFITSTGSFWVSDLKVNSADATEQLNPRVILDQEANADLYVVWQSNHLGNFDIILKKFNRDGGVLIEEKKINSDGGVLDQYVPDVAFDGSDHFYLVWADERNSQPDIYFQKIDKDGNSQFSSDIKINDDSFATARRTKPSVAYASDSAIYISWEDNRNGNTVYNIYASRVDSTAARTWTYDMILSDVLNSMQTDSVLLCDSYGKALTVWQDNRNEIDNDLFAAYYNEMGNVQRANIPITVVSDKTKGSYPDPAEENTTFIPIPKYSTTFTSDLNGDIFIGLAEGGLEWGTYNFYAGSPYDIISIDLPSPILVSPDKESNAVINVGP
ncbi:MAG: prepilin-type N-terminal cleavage/methylation domain-containing protein [Candidatus Paceibacterota bacterium]